MLGVVGESSQIAKEFTAMADEPWRGMRLGSHDGRCNRILVCAGLMLGKRIGSMLPDQYAATFAVNFVDIVAWCDVEFATSPTARIVVVGSESGFSGSYDMAYAGAKAALHMYVETRKLAPGQQLVAIAPGIIEDAGMTTRRADTDALEARKLAHPKGRFVTSREVASLAHWLLGPDGEYVSGTVVRMNGGERR